MPKSADNCPIKLRCQVSTYTFAQFFSNEWFEDSKQHVEQVWIVDDMNRFQSQWQRILRKRHIFVKYIKICIICFIFFFHLFFQCFFFLFVWLLNVMFPTWTHVRTRAAKDGVNCMIWVSAKPSKSRITQPPVICVVGSSIDAAIATWIARNKSFNEHLLGFHFSIEIERQRKIKNVFD